MSPRSDIEEQHLYMDNSSYILGDPFLQHPISPFEKLPRCSFSDPHFQTCVLGNANKIFHSPSPCPSSSITSIPDLPGYSTVLLLRWCCERRLSARKSLLFSSPSTTMCCLRRKILSGSLVDYRDRRIPNYTSALYRPLDKAHRQLKKEV